MTTQAGDVFLAVVALPLNVLKRVDFSPKPGEEKRIASEEGHAGHSVKVWALGEGAPPSFEGVGHGPKGLKWIGTEHELPEGSLMVGFGSDPEGTGYIDGAIECGSRSTRERRLQKGVARRQQWYSYKERGNERSIPGYVRALREMPG